mmetsp:Transcript_28878/g.54553  ORF Transcript_28878/g.54553 Transcript_28878/m.54553 type:complete len:252 (-) Transcript_28878:62-817(-)
MHGPTQRCRGRRRERGQRLHSKQRLLSNRLPRVFARRAQRLHQPWQRRQRNFRCNTQGAIPALAIDCQLALTCAKHRQKQSKRAHGSCLGRGGSLSAQRFLRGAFRVFLLLSQWLGVRFHQGERRLEHLGQSQVPRLCGSGCHRLHQTRCSGRQGGDSGGVRLVVAGVGDLNAVWKRAAAVTSLKLHRLKSKTDAGILQRCLNKLESLCLGEGGEERAQAGCGGVGPLLLQLRRRRLGQCAGHHLGAQPRP